MLFKEYRNQSYFKDKEEIVINKKLKIRDKEILVLSFINYGDKSRLWTLHKNEFKRNEEDVFEYKTNREELIDSIRLNSNGEFINFRNMTIQSNKVNFEYSYETSMEYANGIDILSINHFINSGLVNEVWDDINIEDMIFTTYEIGEEDTFPNINKNEKIDIELYIEADLKEKLIQHPFKVRIDEYEKNTKIYYKDYNGIENFFYLDSLIKYDLRKNTLENMNANIDKIDEEYRQSYMEEGIKDIESICGKDMDYTAIFYENEENEQLRFLTNKYLNKKPVLSSSSTSMMWLSSEEYGQNGYFQYTDGIEAVEKNFDKEMEIELFSKFIKVPEETIKFNID